MDHTWNVKSNYTSIFLFILPHVNLLNICDKLSLPEEIIRAFHEVGALTRGAVFPINPPLRFSLLPDLLSSKLKQVPQPGIQSLTINKDRQWRTALVHWHISTQTEESLQFWVLVCLLLDLFILYVCVFGLHICMCLMCAQCPWCLKEGIGSPRN